MIKLDLYNPQIWAKDITVTVLPPGEQLLVSGTGQNDDTKRSRDVFLRYLSSVKSEFGQKVSSEASPHVVFANAKSDVQLINFVRQFGPIAAKEVFETVEQRIDGRSIQWNEAIVDLASIRDDQRTFAAALELVAELRHYKKSTASTATIRRCASAITEGVLLWPEQWDSERKWHLSHSRKAPGWHFGPEHVDLFQKLKEDAFSSDDHLHPIGHLILCTLTNAFRTEVQYSGYGPIEILPLGSVRFGVRPPLYLVLKHLYLGGGGAQVCENDRCRDFFSSERAGQRFCKVECSQRFRQRKYWSDSGSDRRKRRTAKRHKK